MINSLLKKIKKRVFFTKKNKSIKYEFLGEYIDICCALSILLHRYPFLSEEEKATYKSYAESAISFSAYEYDISFNDDAKILFYYASDFFRKDSYGSVLRIKKTINNVDTILPAEVLQIHEADEKSSLHASVMSIQASMIKAGFEKDFVDVALFHLIMIEKTKRLLENQIQPEKYKALVVYYDLTPSENMMVQAFKAKGIPTYTLQHGVFQAPEAEPETIEQTGIMLTDSICDKLIVWNQFTKDHAIAAGLLSEQVDVVGIPKFIDYHNDSYNSTRRRCLGVTLGGVCYDKQNRKMIDIVNDVAQRTGIKYCLRYHPSLMKGEYDGLIKPSYIDKFDVNEMDMLEYGAALEYYIVYNSSAYIELVYQGCNVYHYADGSKSDVYAPFSTGSFTDAQGLERLLKNMSEPDETTFEYLCTTKDSGAAYRNYFAKIVRE